MINNTPISQIHIIQQQQSKHRRRLQKIIQSRPISNQYTMSNNFIQMLQTRRLNHEKWRQFNRNQERYQIMMKNQKMFNKLIDLTIESSPYSQQKVLNYSIQKIQQGNNQSIEKKEGSIENNSSNISRESKRARTNSLHHNYQLQNIRKSRIIDQQNPKIAQRIMKQSGMFSHTKDLEQFRKTRQILHRIQKFDQIKRVFNSTRAKQFRGSSEIRIRSKTLPSGPKTLQTKLNKTNIANAEAQTLQLKNDHLKKQNKIQNNIKKIQNSKFAHRKNLQKRYRTIQSIGEQTQFASQQFTKPKQNGQVTKKFEQGEQQDYQLMNKYLKSQNQQQRKH